MSVSQDSAVIKLKEHRSLREQIRQQNEKLEKNSKEETKERFNPMQKMIDYNNKIYQYYLEHDISYKELAAMFKVSYDQVRKLVSRRGVKKK